jgi:hypothetical protein
MQTKGFDTWVAGLGMTEINCCWSSQVGIRALDGAGNNIQLDNIAPCNITNMHITSLRTGTKGNHSAGSTQVLPCQCFSEARTIQVLKTLLQLVNADNATGYISQERGNEGRHRM